MKAHNRLFKLICVFLAVMMTVSLFGGCAKTDFSRPSNTATTAAVNKDLSEAFTVGVVQFEDAPALDLAREAFMTRLEEWSFDEDKVTVEYSSANGDITKAANICEDFVKNKTDFILAIGAPVADAAVAAANGTDTIVIALGGGEMGGNKVAGLSDASPAEMVELMTSVNTDMRKLGVLYDPADAVSAEQVKLLTPACQAKNIEVVEATVSKNVSDEDLKKTAEELFKSSDAVFTPTDVTVSSHAATVAQVSRKKKTPWYAGDEALVQLGAMLTYCTDHEDMGRKAADAAVAFMSGTSLQQEEPARRIFVNQDAADDTRITLPANIQEKAYFYADTKKKQ